MKQSRPPQLLAIPLVLALVAGASFPSVAYADDETPPPTENSTQVSVPIAAPAVDPLASAPPVEENAPAETSDELLANPAADGTANGDAATILPAPSAQSQHDADNGDPIWCPAGVAVPVSNGKGCSPSYGQFNSLGGLWVWLLLNDPNKAGTIWIEKSYLASSAGDTSVTFDGADFTTMDNFSLTLKGGWNGLGTGTVDTGDASIFDAGALTIMNWNGNVTISDVEVLTGALADPNPNLVTSGFEPALYVDTTRNISLLRTYSLANTGAGVEGAFLDNSAGTGSVTVTDSTFALNAYVGLRIRTSGAITLTSAAVDGNGFHGAIVDNNYGASASPITITGSEFDANNTNGLYVFHSNGTVTLKDVLAQGNGTGAVIDNSAGSGNVILLNTNRFLANTSAEGLRVITLGTFSAKHLIADENLGSGVYITNAAALVQKTVTISGSGQFNGNGNHGLEISSTGAVTLNNITSTVNANDGAHISNTALVTVAASVTLNGTNDFSSNSSDGLYVVSNGLVKINKTTATDNGGMGLYLSNLGSPTSQGVSILGFLTAIGNGDRGLHLSSHGTVSLTNLTMNNNGQEGAYVANSAASSPKSVTISGTNTMNYNASEGLGVYSRGAITLNNLTVLSNGFTGDSEGVVIYNKYDTSKQMAVTLNGTNVINGNSNDGIDIYSYGAVTLNNVTANENGWGSLSGIDPGVMIDNKGGLLPKTVQLKAANVLNHNGGQGLDVASDGAITVSKITASNNGAAGASLDNSSLLPTLQSKVSVTGYGLFEWNTSFGLQVISNGSISATNLTATYNEADGVYLGTTGKSGPQTINLGGNNNFTYNGINGLAGSGLVAYSDGNININNLNASHNRDNGAVINNFNNWNSGSFASFGSVTLSGFANFIGNANVDGLNVSTHGNVTLNRVAANTNGNGLGDHGIKIYADGKVSLFCSNAYNNMGFGLYVDGNLSLTPTLLTLKGFLAYSNGTNEVFNGTPVVRTACP